MGKYEVQCQCLRGDTERWIPVKNFIFQFRALKYISKRVVDNGYANKWRVIDTAYSKQVQKVTGAKVTRIVCTVERKNE